MKKLFLLFAFIFVFRSLSAQSIIKGTGTIYFAGKASMDLYTPNISFGSETAITVDNGKPYTWDRVQHKWIPIDNTGTDDQVISLAGTTLTLENGGSVDLSTLQDGTGTDNQVISLVGTTLSLENGGSVNLSLVQDGTGTDDQVISLVGTTLTLENGGSVDLSTLQDGTGTDDQVISLVGTTLSLENGGSVNLSIVQDGVGTDDQILSLAGTTLSIESGNSVNLSSLQDGTGTDDQQISLSGSNLILEDGGSVDLSALISGGGTDDQLLNLTGTTLSIESGNSVDLSILQDGIGTDDQQLSLSGTTLTLEDGGSVNLSSLQDGIGTDDQTLSLAGTTLSIESGNSVNLASLQDGIGTDDQQLSLSGATLSLEDGGSVDLSILQDGTGTDDQTISLAGTTLSIENGNSVNLSSLQDGTGTDDQQLSLASNILTLEDGGSVDLSGYLNTDDQTLSLTGTTLSIEDGNSVDLASLQDGNTNIYNTNGSLPAATIRGIQFGSNASRFRYLDPDNPDQYFELFNNSTLSGKAGMYILDDDLGSDGNIGEIGPSVYGVLTAATASVKGSFASLINAPGTTFFAVDGSDIARIQSSVSDYRIGNPGTPSSLLSKNNALLRIMVYDHTTGKVQYKEESSIVPTIPAKGYAQIDRANTVVSNAFTAGSWQTMTTGFGFNETSSNATFTYTGGTGAITFNGTSGANIIVSASIGFKSSNKLGGLAITVEKDGAIPATQENHIADGVGFAWNTLPYYKIYNNVSNGAVFKLRVKSDLTETLDLKNIHLSIHEF
ncbi:MAG: hypothetical protein KDC85_21905 [Saprospiraceae bacterium]|nr:hypothetical protein [Saprospiraceae bacterium]MCB9322893.1 hypothetical protein [Lewinellaceae bacterium]